jgi:dTDP-glucose 4,6-dehydratase
MADGLIRLAASDVEEPVNIGNPQEITIREFAEEIIRLCGGRSTLTFVERPKDDPNLRCPDITRARTLLGWAPMVDRKEGLAKTVAWFQRG